MAAGLNAAFNIWGIVTNLMGQDFIIAALSAAFLALTVFAIIKVTKHADEISE